MRTFPLVLAAIACRQPATEDKPRVDSPPTTAPAPTTSPTPDAPLALVAVDPGIVDPIGGSTVVVSGTGLLGVERVSLGGEPALSFEVLSDTEISVVTGPTAPGTVTLLVARGEEQAELSLDAWSPAELPGARLFDAASGVAVAEPVTAYEWQRLTPEIHPDWRVRDGNTTNWLPATGRFWMVGGWNGLQEPDGFSTVVPDSVYPPENTTSEVWSSADGVAWVPELLHGNSAFERRHSHNTMLWNDQLWMIGGDFHQGFANHDVVWSADGVTWTVALGPGTTEPPWSERVLQVSGVYAGKLWTGGGQEAGDPNTVTYHNDLWSTEDGVAWTQVAPDGPASATRWAGCGVLDGFVEFKGEMWLVGCARERSDAVGHSMFNEVWSTRDGVTWTLHAEPPWAGKIWPNVVVWDGKIWILFGYTNGDPANGWTAGNANEAWYSEDGETWTSLPWDAPVPGSHAQGVAVTDDFLLLAGGNYSFGFGDGFDASAWRLVPFRGDAVTGWVERGADALSVAPLDDGTRPVWIADGFGVGVPGLHFDGSTSVLALDGTDAQPAGRSVFWVARAPYLPNPYGWFETYDPVGTIVGGPVDGGWSPVSSVGLSEGEVVYVNREEGYGASGELLWSRVAAGSGLQEGTGEARFAGVTHALDGTVAMYADGVEVGPAGAASYATARAWSRIGGGMDGYYEGPNSRFSGTIGAVVVLPEATDPETVARIHAWAQGRFGVR